MIKSIFKADIATPQPDVDLIEKRGPSQIAAASITGMTQPKISQVRRYKLQNISWERLMHALIALDQRVGRPFDFKFQGSAKHS